MVNCVVVDGVFDGLVKFYLVGIKLGGKVIEKGLVINKKINGFVKFVESLCDYVFCLVLI